MDAKVSTLTPQSTINRHKGILPQIVVFGDDAECFYSYSTKIDSKNNSTTLILHCMPY